MTIPDSYLSIAQSAEGMYKDKGSKFIGTVFPVKDIQEIKEQLQILREVHPKARHICYAYRLGFSAEEARVQDDGEPAGSAGKPILNTLLSANLHYCLIAVVRYFGGTLLGVPGLIHAYKEASLEAIAAANIIEIQPMDSLQITCSYPNMNDVMKIIKKHSLIIEHQEVNNTCTFTLRFPRKLATQVQQSFEDFISFTPL